MFTVLSGGVGAARFLRGLQEVVDPSEIVAVVNTADDFVLHGLTICPDLDTIRYTLSNDVGEQGWGRANETWNALDELSKIASIAPEGSLATSWFKLGDRDIATNLYRSQRLAEGADLTTVTRELCKASGIEVELVPMTNDSVATKITLTSGETIDFQEYFVKRQHEDPVRQVGFAGAENATPTRRAIEAIEKADRVIIAPSNPVLSIGPQLALGELAATLRSRRDDTIAISPLVNGKAIKGPADHLMEELGSQSNAVGVADLWHSFASALVIDESDAHLSTEIESVGMSALSTSTVMKDLATAAQLASFVIDAKY